MRFSYVGLVLVGVQGRGFMKGPFQADAKRQRSVGEYIPFPIALGCLLGSFITWEEVCATAGGLPYLCLSARRSSQTKPNSGKDNSAATRRAPVSGVSINAGRRHASETLV